MDVNEVTNLLKDKDKVSQTMSNALTQEGKMGEIVTLLENNQSVKRFATSSMSDPKIRKTVMSMSGSQKKDIVRSSQKEKRARSNQRAGKLTDIKVVSMKTTGVLRSCLLPIEALSYPKIQVRENMHCLFNPNGLTFNKKASKLCEVELNDMVYFVLVVGDQICPLTTEQYSDLVQAMRT